ncbi:hypothetical protein CASFOL_032039 [Castilleja foliolosa]|uniref:Uncharacterized protein n=1 Tax=Castilleja foliolosa TaxID=1961234 RepID=A0ABD3C191_9LAMI
MNRNETDLKSDVEKRDLLKETPLPAINATYSARIGLLVGNPKYKSESKPENLKPPRPRHPGRGAARPPPSATNSPAEKSRLRSDDDSKADLEFSACVRRTNGGGKSRRNGAELPGMENRRPERERVGEMTAGYHGERQTVTENVPRTAAMKLRNEKGAQTLSPLQSVDDGCDVSKWDQMGLANGDGVHVLENWNPNGPLSNGSKGLARNDGREQSTPRNSSSSAVVQTPPPPPVAYIGATPPPAATTAYTFPQYQQAQQLFQRDDQTITPEALEGVKAALASSDMEHKAETKKKAIPRKAAGQAWEDPTLAEWPENDFRLFCGDLGNEVNDDVLSKAFARFPHFNMARGEFLADDPELKRLEAEMNNAFRRSRGLEVAVALLAGSCYGTYYVTIETKAKLSELKLNFGEDARRRKQREHDDPRFCG